MRISIVVPCYRSPGTLSDLVEGARASMSALGVEHELIFVVDGSPDDTGDEARKLTAGNVRVIELLRNYGQHNALVAGIRVATGDIIVTMDDDLQHPPSEIPALIEPLLTRPEVDLVYGVPEDEEHGRTRSMASRLVKSSLAASGVANARIVGAFRAFRAVVGKTVSTTTDPSINLDVALSWATNRVVAAPVRMEKRAAGRSGYRLSTLISHAVNMVTGYGVLPLKLASWAGFAFAIVALGLFVTVVVRFAIGETTVAGFTTLAAMIALFASAQMFAIGIIGEYLGRQHFRSMQKPVYLIRSDSHDAERTSA